MTTIAEAVGAACARPGVSTVWTMLRRTYEERRIIEALFGIWCFVRLRPSAIADRRIEGARAMIDAMLASVADGDVVTGRDLKQILPVEAAILPDEVLVRHEALLLMPDGWVVGEYGDGSRIFYGHSGRELSVEPFYEADPLVKHIHVIHRLDAERLAICTGDAGKHLDIWRIGEGGFRFERRLLEKFAGFTAATLVSGDHYFGSDFTGRPNYLLRLSDGKKFPFPDRNFTHYAVKFQAFEERYVLGVTKQLDVLGGQRGWFVFDTLNEQYVTA